MRKNQLKASKGFTLIELLIVIALLGALAVGLLAALDPFEQLKKGNDTGARNTVSEIQGAVIRYYGIKNNMPWGASVLALSTASAWYKAAISPIVDVGELKTDFSVLGANFLPKIYMKGTDASVTVCFKPESKAFIADPNTKFYSADLATGCSTPGTCYWCVE